MPVGNSKKTLAVSNLPEEVSISDRQISIDVVDNRLQKTTDASFEFLRKFAEEIVNDAAPNKRPLEMNVFLLDPEEISILNEKHLFKEGPTDVLAFPRSFFWAKSVAVRFVFPAIIYQLYETVILEIYPVQSS